MTETERVGKQCRIMTVTDWVRLILRLGGTRRQAYGSGEESPKS